MHAAMPGWQCPHGHPGHHQPLPAAHRGDAEHAPVCAAYNERREHGGAEPAGVPGKRGQQGAGEAVWCRYAQVGRGV